jgi:hypothetical protein
MPVTSVSQALVAELCAALGYEPRDVRSIDIEPRRITVTSFRRDDNGRLVVLEHEDIATTTDVIRIEPRPSVLNQPLAAGPEAIANA